MKVLCRNIPSTEKRTSQENAPSGPDRYMYKGAGIFILPYFLYEVSIHKYWKNGYCLLGSKYYKSKSLLDIKKSIRTKKFKDYTISKEIELLAAPYEFIRDNNLQKVEIIVKSKKSRKK